ncbi:Universal stress protein A 1 [Nymphon striatum]|nr:Universal stress protein A 1 [Nymphon striatum]
MDTKEVQEKLQNAYKSMLEHIEELVEKDKKPLKQAFEEAEEKLSEWRELSREEVDKISDELKTNLSDWGDASHRLNESLKETFDFDKKYLATNIWNSLSKVADKTIVEFNEFTDDLQKHMATDASSYSEQQQIWFNDAMQWQGDYEKALKQLDELRAGVRKQITKTGRYSKNVSKELSEIPLNEPHIYAFQISGKLVADDYAIFRPKLERILKKESPLSLLVQLEEFDGWTAKSAWEDLKIGLDHGQDFLRIAFVGEHLWEKVMIELGNLFMKAEVRYFQDDSEAINWLKEVENKAEENEYTGYRHVLVATDFSKYADAALKKALELAKPFSAKVSLVHAAETLSAELYPSIGELAVPVLINNPEQEEKHLARIKKQMEDHIEKHGYADNNIDVQVLSGHRVDEIVEYASKNNVDLIVMGSHGRRGLARLVGSSTNGVIHHAPCDVLTVV